MRDNLVKDTLERGGVAIGTFVMGFPSQVVGHLASLAGASFLVYDMEHTGWGFETISTVISGSRSASALPFVRVPTSQRSYVSRALDIGAVGVMVPMVESRQQAESIVRWAMYPPVGVRGAAFGVAHDDYVVGDPSERIANANENLLLIAQVETAAGLRCVDEIAAVEGIHVLWVGHFDLTNSLDIPGQFSHPDYLQALDRVAKAAASHGKAAGFMASSVQEVQSMVQRGYRCLAYSSDLRVYGDSLQAALGELAPLQRREKTR